MRVCKSVGGSEGGVWASIHSGGSPDSATLPVIERPEEDHAIDHRGSNRRRRRRGGGAVTLAVVERRDRCLSKLGLTLAEGRALLAEAQAALVSQQVDGWMSGETNCRRCGAALSHKDSRTVVVRTVFGNVAVTSPRLWSCCCRAAPGAPRRFHESAVQSAARARHTRTGVPPGQMGRLFSLQAGHGAAQGEIGRA